MSDIDTLNLVSYIAAMTLLQSECHVRSGDGVSLDVLCEAFNFGFEDYKYGTKFTPPELQSFLLRSGVNVSDCALLTSGTQRVLGVGIALLALHDQSAWCAGLAVAASYRRAGHAMALMEAIEATARAKGATRLYLEVLTENHAAYAMYQKRGYRNLRKLHIWQHFASDSVIKSNSGPRMVHVEVEPLLHAISNDQHRVRPAWQRSTHYLQYSAHDIMALKVDQRQDHTGAFALLGLPAKEGNPTSPLRIADIGLLPGSDNDLVIADLLALLTQEYAGASKTLLNEPDHSPLSSYLSAAGYEIVETQFEMVKDLV